MEKHTVVGVDIAKSVFEVAVSKEPGRVSDRRRPSRAAFLVFLAQVPQGTVIMEACGSAHYWGRRIQELGHHEAEDTFAVPTFPLSCATLAPVPTLPQGFNERRSDELTSLSP